MKRGMFFLSPISSSICSTASLAPPCSGPYSAAIPALTAENGSTCDEPTARTALVEQFCSWSAWRISRISSARCSTLLGLCRPPMLNVMLTKLPM